MALMRRMNLQEISSVDNEGLVDLNVHYTGAKHDDVSNFLIQVWDGLLPYGGLPCMLVSLLTSLPHAWLLRL